MGSSDASSHDLLTTGEAADLLREFAITRRQVSRMVHAGELPAVRRAPGAWARIPRAAVLEFLATLRAQRESGNVS